MLAKVSFGERGSTYGILLPKKVTRKCLVIVIASYSSNILDEKTCRDRDTSHGIRIVTLEYTICTKGNKNKVDSNLVLVRPIT